MKKYGKRVIIVLFLCVGVLVMWHYFIDSPRQQLDDEANQQFARKARELHIIGKPRTYVIEHFGEPNYSQKNAHKEILVYLPGPENVTWRSECKITVDLNTGLVTSWGINSD